MPAAAPSVPPSQVKIQLAVKGAKGVIIDHDAVARETKSYSKNILDLVRLENRATGTDTADLQDVGDRAALLFYKQGEVRGCGVTQLPSQSDLCTDGHVFLPLSLIAAPR